MVRELLGVSSVGFSRPWKERKEDRTRQRKARGEGYESIEVQVDLLGDERLSIDVLARLACDVLRLPQAVSLILAPLE